MQMILGNVFWTEITSSLIYAFHETMEGMSYPIRKIEAEPKKLHNAFSVACSPVVFESIIIVYA